MDFSMEKIAPFFLKVTQVFSKEFMFSKNHFEFFKFDFSLNRIERK